MKYILTCDVTVLCPDRDSVVIVRKTTQCHTRVELKGSVHLDKGVVSIESAPVVLRVLYGPLHTAVLYRGFFVSVIVGKVVSAHRYSPLVFSAGDVFHAMRGSKNLNILHIMISTASLYVSKIYFYFSVI